MLRLLIQGQPRLKEIGSQQSRRNKQMLCSVGVLIVSSCAQSGVVRFASIIKNITSSNNVRHKFAIVLVKTCQKSTAKGETIDERWETKESQETEPKNVPAVGEMDSRQNIRTKCKRNGNVRAVDYERSYRI